MGLFKFIYSKQSMKRKILDIKDDMIKLVKTVCSENVWINSYGAYDIDPKYLVFWICIDTDRAKKQLKENYSLMNDLRELLVKYNYPIESRQFVKIDFESQETVQKKSNGNWFEHFK
jgi:hypothetical protein